MTQASPRPASATDLPALLRLYRHLHPEDATPDMAQAEAAWDSLLSSGYVTVFVVDGPEGLAASCVLALVPNLTRGARPFGVIENVVTDAGLRRRGHGRAVLRAALEAAWEAGCYKVMLATGSRREETLRFYEAAGFERGGKTFFQARRP